MGTKRPTVVVLSFLSSAGDSAYYLPGTCRDGPTSDGAVSSKLPGTIGTHGDWVLETLCV